MTSREIVIGTRGSALALAQARLAEEALEQAGHTAHLVTVETDGDRRAPDTAWGEGAFVKAIETALLAGHIDLAVHSAKDVPTDEDPRLAVVAYLRRADARDALAIRGGASGSLDMLPEGASIGTDSPRRSAFLLARRPDLQVRPLHGNVDTRLRRLDDGEADALVLACAGLDRLGRSDRIAQRLDPEQMPPAPGQGAIALQVRRDDQALLALLESINDGATRLTVEAERALLWATGGGCRAPVGAYGEIRGADLTLIAGHAEPDGSGLRIGRRTGPATEAIGIAKGLYRDLWPTDLEAAR